MSDGGDTGIKAWAFVPLVLVASFVISVLALEIIGCLMSMAHMVLN